MIALEDNDANCDGFRDSRFEIRDKGCGIRDTRCGMVFDAQ